MVFAQMWNINCFRMILSRKKNRHSHCVFACLIKTSSYIKNYLKFIGQPRNTTFGLTWGMWEALCTCRLHSGKSSRSYQSNKRRNVLSIGGANLILHTKRSLNKLASIFSICLTKTAQSTVYIQNCNTTALQVPMHRVVSVLYSSCN